MIAGLDTVAASLACFLSYLARHPDERRRLVADPSLWPSAIEELMRFESPVTDGGRIALADLELPSGEHIAAGTQHGHLVARGEPRSRRSSPIRSPSTSAAPRTPTSGSRAASTAASVRTSPGWRCTSRSRRGTSGSPTTRSRRAPTSPTAATRARRTTSRSPGEPRRHADPGGAPRGDPGLVGRAPRPASSRAIRASAAPPTTRGGSCAWRGSASSPTVAGSASRGRSSTAAAAGTLEEELVFLEEHFRARAPYWVGVHGRDLFGPTLLHAGSDEQKARFLPRIMALRGDVGAGLQRAGGGIRSRRRAHPCRPRGRRVGAERPEDLDDVRHARRLVVRAVPDRSRRAEAPRALVDPRARRPAGRRRPADPQPRRRRGVRRGVLHRRAHRAPTSSWARSTARGRS